MIYTKKSLRNRIAELKVQKAMSHLSPIPTENDVDWEISLMEQMLADAEAHSFDWKNILSNFKK